MIELINDIFKRFTDDGLLIEPHHLNFDNLMLYLSNLDRSIKYIFEKAKISGDSNGDLNQIMNVLDVNVILKSNNEIEADAYFKDTKTRNFLPYVSPHPQSCKNNEPYHITEKIISLVSDKKKADLRLKELRQNNKCPNHIIPKNSDYVKLQGSVRKQTGLVAYRLKVIFSKTLNSTLTIKNI